MNTLHADSIRKTIDDRTILNDIFLSCEKGEILGLLGRNGSGKSTLLKIIFGSVSADHKFVKVGQKRTSSLFGTRDIIKYLPQENWLPGHKKLKDIISCFCENASEVHNHPLVAPFLGKKVGQLSGGERRMVEVLLMVHSEASILLFDEPFNGIAPLNIETIKEIIRLHAKEKAVIITDHDYHHVIDIATRLVLLQDGNTKIINNLSDLFDFGYLPESARKSLESN